MSRNGQKSVLLACLSLMAFKAENAAPGSNTNSIASKPQNTSYSKQENLKSRNKNYTGTSNKNTYISNVTRVFYGDN
jgi:hypothetical protein